MKTITIAEDNFDIEGFIDKILKFLKKVNKRYGDDNGATRIHIFNPDEDDFWEEPINYLKKTKKDFLLDIKQGHTLFFPFTTTPYAYENEGDPASLESADGLEINGRYTCGSAAGFLWGDDEDDMDTFLDVADHVGFIVSMIKSKYIIKSGIFFTGEIEKIEYFTNEKKYDLFSKPMEKFIKSFIKK